MRMELRQIDVSCSIAHVAHDADDGHRCVSHHVLTRGVVCVAEAEVLAHLVVDLGLCKRLR